MAKRIIVAIDGPAGAGKSSVAREVARRLNFIYIDTGAMYRSIALWAIRTGVGPDDSHKLEALASEAKIEFDSSGNRVFLNDEDVTDQIRTPEVSEMASAVSTHSAVRRLLVAKQQAMGSEQNVVMEGRDIGSVVFPDAHVKVFLDANPEVRAGRRAAELNCTSEKQIRTLADRDRRDRTRAESPLVQAPDAQYLDTSALPFNEVVEAVLRLVRERTTNGKEYAHG
jgi:cytidylate kinase